MGLHKANQTSFKKGNIPIAPFAKGHVPWNKGMTFNEEETARWKGENVGYQALHMWVRKHLGRATVCEFCFKTKGKMEWANRSHEYKRDLTDWLSLCVSCHAKYDERGLKRNRDSHGRFI